MKKQFLFFLLLVSGFGFSQSVNDYKAVLIPLKFEFLKHENQYRLSTLSKINLNKAGFEAYYLDQPIPDIERCTILNFDILKIKHFLVTKLYILFKDCYGRTVFQSEVGKSTEKEYETAYTEALNNAFKSVYALNYKYNDKKSDDVKVESFPVAEETVQDAEPVSIDQAEVSENAETNNKEILYAQAIENGFQLVDSKPSIVMKIFKTSDKNSFLAKKGDLQGIFIVKENQYLFEYYQDNKLISEKVNVKF